MSLSRVNLLPPLSEYELILPLNGKLKSESSEIVIISPGLRKAAFITV